LFVWVSTLLPHAQYKDFDIYQETLSFQEAKDKIGYLLHDPDIEQFYTVMHDALYVFASAQDQHEGKSEFVLRFGTRPKPQPDVFKPNHSVTKSLAGLRIAIDPGHLGGDMASVEERFVTMTHPNKKTHIQFAEGDLTFWTAKILKFYLTKTGADVLLTRETIGQPVYDRTFSDWCLQAFGVTNDEDWLATGAQKKLLAYVSTLSQARQEEFMTRLKSAEKKSDKQKIQYIKQALCRLGYNSLDLSARAEKINAFNPHLTIIIHYNANGGSSDMSSDDYNLAFIPGSFLQGELAQRQARYEFVRMLVTDDIEDSLCLSRSIVKMMAARLQVPLMQSSSYQKENACFVENGIYCRNLVLTRLIHGPLCYGETLIQNNPVEAERLGTNDFNFYGTMVSSRVAEVAAAYYEGICDYFGVKSQPSLVH